MENSQRVEPELPEPAAPAPEETTAKSKYNSPWNFFLRLIAYHPWLLVVALLAAFAGSAAISLYSLGFFGLVEQQLPATQQALSEVEVVEPISPPAENANPLPLWVVVAIALSCAGGCLFIFRFLNRAAVPHKNLKRNRYLARQVERNQQPSEPRAFTEPRPLKNPPVFVLPQPRMPIPTTYKKTKAVVTILPPAPTKPFITRKESLADSLDLRKQSSLSSILRKN
jgi:hypothetical protein